MIITSSRASDIVELFRPSRFDGHVTSYRRVKWLADTADEYDLRFQAMQAEVAKIMAEARAGRISVIVIDRLSQAAE